MPTEEYLEARLPVFRGLITDSRPESEVQDFLERNPAFIHAAVHPHSNHQGYDGLVIARPPLPGFGAKVPDFMVIRSNSLTWYPTLIEIESPGKKLFTKSKRIPTAHFNQARNQLAEWKSWFLSPVNQQLFQNEYGLPIRGAPWHDMTTIVQRLLIYGRREEFATYPALRRQRSSLLSDPEFLASFDRLAEQIPTVIRSEFDAITVKASGAGRFQALHVAPTFGLWRARIDRLLYVDGLDDAIDRNPDIADERKEFLKRRVAYWKQWEIESRQGLRSLSGPIE